MDYSGNSEQNARTKQKLRTSRRENNNTKNLIGKYKSAVGKIKKDIMRKDVKN